MQKQNGTTKGEKTMEVGISERYVNPYTDFGFKKFESKKDYWDNYSIVTTAHKKGRDEAKLEIARGMKAKGYPLEDIAEITGLTAAEIKNL